MNYHDRLMHGALAGLAGGTVQTVYAVIMKYLHITEVEFVDYAEILTLGRDYGGVTSIVGVVGHLINATFWGMLFALIIRFSRQRFYITKGVGLGIFIWLFSLGLATMYKLPIFHTPSPRTAFVLLFGAILWGFVMSYVYEKLDQKVNVP